MKVLWKLLVGNFVNNTFCARSLWGEESFVHGTDGMPRRVGSKFKSFRSPPREAKKSNTQPLSRALNLARCTPRKAPSSSHQPVWHSIWRYPTKRLRCQLNSRKTSWTHLRSSQTCWRFGARSGFDEGHAVSAFSMGLSRPQRGREEGERRSR